MKRSIYSFIFFLCIAFFYFNFAVFAQPASDTVVLQLKWRHQAQFAGYYAAIAKGYYKKKGLYVKLRERGKGVAAVDEVVSGRADFGISDSQILLAREKGKPIVLLACIFQHSPTILLTLKKSNINSPHDF